MQVAFSLHGDQGPGVQAAGSPFSAEIPCGTDPVLTTGEPTVATRPGLTVGGSARYTYPWRTSPSWAGTCRQLVVQLDDGTFHRADFRFR